MYVTASICPCIYNHEAGQISCKSVTAALKALNRIIEIIYPSDIGGGVIITLCSAQTWINNENLCYMHIKMWYNFFHRVIVPFLECSIEQEELQQAGVYKK